ncbi:MAG: alpha/beta hydrolase [Gammaproteobacteria bacterium]|nr:alpha/beta hydrolase [Gammaproteobacteria bacterium]
MHSNRWTVLLAFLGLAACGAEAPPPSSASDGVEILPPLTMNQLGRERAIRIYLPPNYSLSDRRYPVVYMHDGQNLFDDATSYSGEWGVDESLDELAATSRLALIVVGIDNGGEKRMNELSPWPNADIGDAEGEGYMDFIVNQLKPMIDQKYRTLSDRDNTAILGSSMGGLISHYAVTHYPNIFSKAGIFSPSYWFSPEVYEYTRERPPTDDARLYLMIGEREGEEGVDNLLAMEKELLELGHPPNNLHTEVVPDGEHHEALWRAHFAHAITWLFAAN